MVLVFAVSFYRVLFTSAIRCQVLFLVNHFGISVAPCLIITRLCDSFFFSFSLNYAYNVQVAMAMRAPFAAAREVCVSVQYCKSAGIRFFLQRWSKEALVLIEDGSGLHRDVARIVQCKSLLLSLA